MKGVNCNGVQDCVGLCFTKHVADAFSVDKYCDNGQPAGSGYPSYNCAYYKYDAGGCDTLVVGGGSANQNKPGGM